jgi:hypothetical protein
VGRGAGRAGVHPRGQRAGVSRRVADGGRQRLHLDLEVRRPPGFQLSLRATVAFAEVAKPAIRLFGSTAGAFGKSDIVDMGLLMFWLPPPRCCCSAVRTSWRPCPGRALPARPAGALSRRARDRGRLTEAKRAEWLATAGPANPEPFPVIVAAGELAQGTAGGAGHPGAGLPGRQPRPRGVRGGLRRGCARCRPGGARPVRPPSRRPLRSPRAHDRDTCPARTGAQPGPTRSSGSCAASTRIASSPLLERSDGVYAQVGFGPRRRAPAPTPSSTAPARRRHLRPTPPTRTRRALPPALPRGGDERWRARMAALEL